MLLKQKSPLLPRNFILGTFGELPIVFSTKATGPDCIPVVLLKNREPELSYTLAELFSKCVKKCVGLVFQIVGRFHR